MARTWQRAAANAEQMRTNARTLQPWLVRAIQYDTIRYDSLAWQKAEMLLSLPVPQLTKNIIKYNLFFTC